MAECYTLTSCQPLLYPDIPNLCWDTTHPYQGLVVYIAQVYNGNPVDATQTYTLTFNGSGTCVCDDWLPQLRTTTENTCAPSYGIFQYQNCENPDEFRTFGFTVADPVNNVLRVDGDCECWSIIGESDNAEELLASNYTEYDDCKTCLEVRADTICPSGERSLSYALRVSLPDNAPPDRGFSECCYQQIVLADSSDSDPYKNDWTGVYFKRQIPNTTVVFKLVDTATMTEYVLNSATYGEYQAFGGTAQPDLTYYIVDWRKVLNTLGVGAYQIKQEITIAGISDDYYSNTFNLKPFTVDNADKTVRIEAVQNGFLVRPDVDFKGTNFTTSLRVRGFFGRKERSFEQDNLFKRDYDSEQVTMSVINEYKFQGLKLPDCITDEIFDFILFGNRIEISDYNKNNHSYRYESAEVELANNEGTEYFVFDRKANINLTFTDRFKNNRKTNC